MVAVDVQQQLRRAVEAGDQPEFIEREHDLDFDFDEDPHSRLDVPVIGGGPSL